MQSQEETIELYNTLEQHGEEEVRRKLAIGAYSADKKGLVETWLGQRKEAHKQEHNLETIKVYREANQLAAKANAIADGARKSARLASWVAVTSLLIALAIAIFK